MQTTLAITPAPPPPTPRRSQAREVAMLLTLVPPAAAWLALEARLPALWPLPFPRGVAELESHPMRLPRLLTTRSRGLLRSPVPAGATPVGQRRLDGLDNEPDKDRTTARWELTFAAGAVRHRVRVVTKFQSGRAMPLYMQAIRAVFERRFSREVAFYTYLAGEVPVRVATPYFADAVPSVNRVCLVLEYVEGINPADWQGGSLPQVERLLAAAARLNAAYLGRTREPQVAWIPARAGLQFAGFVELFLGRDAPAARTLWAALKAYFAPRAVTLVHGDCRPGNMLFPEDGSDVVLSDWEAVNVAPVLWDFTYCTVIGLRVDDRRAWLDRLLDDFSATVGVDRRVARVEVDLLALVLGYVSLTIYEHRLWAQGNAMADIRAWMERVRQAVLDADAAVVASTLGVEQAVVTAFRDAIGACLVLSE